MTIDFPLNSLSDVYEGFKVGEMKTVVAFSSKGQSQLCVYHKPPYVVADLPVNQVQINWGRQNGKNQFMMDVMDFYKKHGRYPTFKEMGKSNV